jgi:hypothetical protein
VGDVVWFREAKFVGLRAKVVNLRVAGLNRIRVAFEKSGDEIDVDKYQVVLVPKEELVDQPFIQHSNLITENNSTSYEYPKEQQVKPCESKPFGESVHIKIKEEKKITKTSNSDIKIKQENHCVFDSLHDKKDETRPMAATKIQQSKPKSRTWLRTGIRVKIISQKVGNGNVYLKKGVILDVYDSDRCSVRLLESNFVLDDVKVSVYMRL